MIKRTLLTLLCTLFTLVSFADEGLWLPSLISERIGDMRAKGFRLTAEDIYSINKASMKDAVVLFGGGCTGELVSSEGLLLTNHHCGYDAIQAHSSVGNDLLTYGFWARSRAEELPNEKLDVRFLVRMEEVTDRLAKGEKAVDIIAKAKEEGVGYRAAIEQMYYGTQQFLFVYEQFDDVRLVAAPPSSIGKFGGDTDNWIWPRHTGDFSVFRIYADKDNKPAKYSPDNVPYRSKRFFTISTQGVKEGDFTMIYGFPGNTQKYILSDAVEYIANRSDPAKIGIRTARLDLIGQVQQSDPALRIYYAAKHASIANSWKKWQGEVLGINRLGTVQTKRAEEAAFEAWAQNKPAFRDVVANLKAEYSRIMDSYFAYELTGETLKTLKAHTAAEKSEPFYEQVVATDSLLVQTLFRAYADHCPEAYRLAVFDEGLRAAGSVEAYAARYAHALYRTSDTTLLGAFRADLKAFDKRIADTLGMKPSRNLNSARLNELYTDYIRGLREWDKRRAFFPDANLTLRVAYGRVEGYEYADGEYHRPLTTLDGIIAKDDPNIYDYDIPQALRDLHASKEYGRWGVELNGHYTVPVCFLASNHTSGGNSGSPVLNAHGELVGINFDRTWRSTMSDIEFDASICRNISVDIRYVLFVLDRVGGVGYLLDEMRIRER